MPLPLPSRESLRESGTSNSIKKKVPSQNYSWSHAIYLDNWRELKLLVKITYASQRVLRKLCLYWGLIYKRPSYDFLIAEGPRMMVENHFLAGDYIHTCMENLDLIGWNCTIYDDEIPGQTCSYNI